MYHLYLPTKEASLVPEGKSSCKIDEQNIFLKCCVAGPAEWPTCCLASRVALIFFRSREHIEQGNILYKGTLAVRPNTLCQQSSHRQAEQITPREHISKIRPMQH